MVFVITNLYSEYLKYIDSKGLLQCKTAMFINSPRKLDGFDLHAKSKPKVVFLPSHTNLPNLQSIREELLTRGWDGVVEQG